MSIKNIIFYDENVFDANVNNLVFVGSKVISENVISICKARKAERDWEYFDNSEIAQYFYMKDDYIIIPVDSMESATIIGKMEKSGIYVKDIATVNFGMQLRDRKKYPADVTMDENLLTDFHRECYTGKDIGEYVVSYSGLYCYFNREAKKGGCWEEEAQLANPKLLCRQIGRYPTVGIDNNGYPVLNTAFMISKFRDNMNPYTLLGVLNSKLIKFYWKQKFSDNRKQFPKIKGTYLELLPIVRNTEIESEIQTSVECLCENINDCETVFRLKEKIDELVYKLYGMEDEVETIRNSSL